MNRIFLAIGCLVLVFTAQTARTQGVMISCIRPYHIYISDHKTTNLIFPGEVAGIDRGSRDILVQKAPVTKNIVQLKAGRVYFPETSLSVITTDGHLFSFLVDYATDPADLTLQIRTRELIPDSDNSEGEIPVELSGKVQEQEFLRKSVPAILKAGRNIYGENSRHDLVKLSLTGLYICRNRFFLRLGFQNLSTIGFVIREIRLFTTDRQRSRRVATQETEINPLAVFEPDSTVAAGSKVTCIITLPEFTLSDSRMLTILIPEKNGGRDLRLRLLNRNLLLAKPLSR
jgi:conjugative transposon TraN protein